MLVALMSSSQVAEILELTAHISELRDRRDIRLLAVMLCLPDTQASLYIAAERPVL